MNVLAELQASAAEGQVYVFVIGKRPAAGGRLKRQNLQRYFHALRRKAGVPACTLHDLRRSYCMNLAGAVPMHVVQDLAGHSDIRTTRQYCVKVRPESLDAARRMVQEMMHE